jgi:hypothetical protein
MNPMDDKIFAIIGWILLGAWVTWMLAVLVLVAIDVFIEARARSLAQGRESDAVTE